jgi:uncharacterized membrane protein YgcG
MGRRGDRWARRLLLVTVWTVATVIAGVVTWSAVARLGHEGSASAQAPLSPSQVRRDLAAEPSVPKRPTTPRVTAPRSHQGQADTGTSQQARRFRSWPVTGGVVSTSCRGSTIRLEAATPNDGWGMQPTDLGPDRVRVEFSNGSADTKVEVVCVRGVPSLEQRTETGGSGSGGGGSHGGRGSSDGGGSDGDG